jgi:hypothetical protein
LKKLSEKINTKATILKTRRWGKPEKAGNWTFGNWIQDNLAVIYINIKIYIRSHLKS